MKRKTEQATRFIEGLHKAITTDPDLRKDVRSHSEKQIQSEIRFLIRDYLIKFFKERGCDEATAKEKCGTAFYWEGQEGSPRGDRPTVFGARNYPDYVIREPYLIAIEYAQSDSGAAIKRGIGQSIMHTMCGEYDFVYYLFHDKSNDKKIERSLSGVVEMAIAAKVWDEFNVFMGFVKDSPLSA